MKNRKKAIVLAAVLLSIPIAAAISETIPVQGKLTDTQGNALTGTYSMLFELYDNNLGGNLLWAETHNTTTANGVFNTTLGDANTNTYLNSVDFNTQTWLSILVDGTRQQPMIKLGSSPSAYSSKHTYGGDSNFANIGISGTLFGTKTGGDLNIGAGLAATGNIKGEKFVSNDANSAYGTNAVALGSGTTAFGDYSVAMGYNTTASESYSTARGYYTTASGYYSTAMGWYTTASGNASTAMGDSTTASGNASTAMGYETTASDYGSLSFGYNSWAAGSFESSGLGSLAGGYIDSDCCPPSNWGNILSSGNGSVALGYASQDNTLKAAGDGAIALGYNVQALGEATVTLGKDIICSAPNMVCANDLNAAGDANFADAIYVNGFIFGGDPGSAGGDSIGIRGTLDVVGTNAFGQVAEFHDGTDTVSILDGTWAIDVVGNAQVQGDMDITGDYYVSGVAGENNSYVDGVDSQIDFTGGIATGISTAYDARLMERVKGIGGSALEFFEGIEPVRFYWNEAGLEQFPRPEEHTKEMIGFKAQDFSAKPGLLVEDGNYITYNRNYLQAMMFKAIKELKAENDLLKEEICRLNPESEIC